MTEITTWIKAFLFWSAVAVLSGITYLSSYADLYLGNGLPHRVLVELEGTTIELGAGETLHRRVRSGVYGLQSRRTDGTLVEDALVSVRKGHKNLYSVRGAAPYYLREVPPGQDGGLGGEAPMASLLGRVVSSPIADHVLRRPFTQAGFKSYGVYLAKHNEDHIAAWTPAASRIRLRHRLQDLEGTRRSLWEEILTVAGPDAAWHYAKKFGMGPEMEESLDRRFVSEQSLRQVAAGGRPEVVRRLARRLPPPEAESLLLARLELHPGEERHRLALARLLVATQRPEEALEQLRGLPAGPEHQEIEAEALIEQGSWLQAHRVLVGATGLEAQLLRGGLAGMLNLDPGEGGSGLLPARCRLLADPRMTRQKLMAEVSPEEMPVFLAEFWATRSPFRAWMVLHDISTTTIRSLARPVRLLFGLDLLRVGARDAGRALLEAEQAEDASTWEQALNPDLPLPPSLAQLPPRLQAIAHFVRARVLAADGRAEDASERQRLALDEEKVRSVVHLAARFWPPPEPASAD